MANTELLVLRDNPHMAKTTKQDAPQWRRTFLREWRIWKGLTLAALADTMDTNEGYLSEIENGKRRYNQDHLEAAASIIGVPVTYLLNRKPPPKGEELDYSDPDLAAHLMETLKPAERKHIGSLIKSFRGEQ